MENNNINNGNDPEEKKRVADLINEYKKNHETQNNDAHDAHENQNVVKNSTIPNKVITNPEELEKTLTQETDPDLITTHEIIDLPSKGLFYKNGLSQVAIEYMTSKDEDILTTPSLIESGKLFTILLKRKIKTNGVNPDDLLEGDRNALLLFLRMSSYGDDYTVEVTDPRTGNAFKDTIDLTKLRYKEITEKPDEDGLFSVELPMRKKIVKFRLLTVGETNIIYDKSEAIKKAFNEEYSQYPTMKLKSSIISIDGKTDRTYIDRFVDAMPARDALTIRKKILEVSPDVDMKYTFTTKDGYSFDAYLTIGVDFFFPST